MPIPEEIAAEVLFKSDRTCCVCRKANKPVQIHHVDSNKLNNIFENLSVLCLDCHTDTQITGGFHRKLTPELVILYRNDWLNIVNRTRLNSMVTLYKESGTNEMATMASIIDDLKDRKEFELLAMFYNQIGNMELRDKSIEKALTKTKNHETIIFLRAMQDKANLIEPKVIEAEITRLKNSKNWTQLGRLYVDIGNWSEAAKYYCQGIIVSVEEGNPFSAAFYLKEANEEKIHEKLFQEALKVANKKGNLWLQIRALQELGWDTELDALLKKHATEIKKSGDPMLLALLYKSLNDEKNLMETRKQIWKNEEIEVYRDSES